MSGVVTDPPYASGGRTESAKRANDTVSNRQTQNAVARRVTWASAPIENDQMTTTGFVWLMRAVGFDPTSGLPGVAVADRSSRVRGGGGVTCALCEGRCIACGGAR